MLRFQAGTTQHSQVNNFFSLFLFVYFLLGDWFISQESIIVLIENKRWLVFRLKAAVSTCFYFTHHFLPPLPLSIFYCLLYNASQNDFLMPLLLGIIKSQNENSWAWVLPNLSNSLKNPHLELLKWEWLGDLYNSVGKINPTWESQV